MTLFGLPVNIFNETPGYSLRIKLKNLKRNNDTLWSSYFIHCISIKCFQPTEHRYPLGTKTKNMKLNQFAVLFLDGGVNGNVVSINFWFFMLLFCLCFSSTSSFILLCLDINHEECYFCSAPRWKHGILQLGCAISIKSSSTVLKHSSRAVISN